MSITIICDIDTLYYAAFSDLDEKANSPKFNTYQILTAKCVRLKGLAIKCLIQSYMYIFIDVYNSVAGR